MSEAHVTLIRQALDPSRSAVVEACAGSGKTWLLASRIVRLLLSGVAPGEILAITFTRKAAREIEERVVGWLHLLATAPHPQVVEFLEERGMTADPAIVAGARGLYERVLAAQPGLAVNTFHGWFLQLVDAAPWSANLAGVTLADSDSRVFDELWQSFAATLGRSPDSALTRDFVALLELAGTDAVRGLIRRATARRSEWYSLGVDEHVIADAVVDDLRARFEVGEPGEALAQFFAGAWRPDFEAYLGLLETSDLSTDQKFASRLAGALNAADNVPASRETVFEGLRDVLLTAANTLRKREMSKALIKRFGEPGAIRLIALHEQLGERIGACVRAQIGERIVDFNRKAAAVFAAFLEHFAAYKAARRQIDFVDAEWNVLRLLRDETTAAFVQARLDARYRQVLLDEFQDTNPLQWQILRAWFDAYSDGMRPRVFVVGDPKQSIYRFRRAEPRLFSVAAQFLVAEFGAQTHAHDTTRRNARPIVEVVNAVFGAAPEFAPFRPQSSLAGELPGRVELLQLQGIDDDGMESDGAAEKAEPAPPLALRNALLTADEEAEDLRRQREAGAVAQKINEIVGWGHETPGVAWAIDERSSDGASTRRPACYGDFMLLVRSRTHLAVYERALAAADIPYEAGSRGGLLETLEVRDIVALLEFLVTPLDDLRLAHALRSPIFGCTDDDLLCLAVRSEPTWWLRLRALDAEGAGGPRLARAARLLDGWLAAAARLPAHDLLDRVLHEGRVLPRYREAVETAAAAGVEANLRALLLLALDLDGGRYPSLPRFIDELRALRDADVSDAPDEGEIASDYADTGRVRLLTIHGAKGLEAPIVWLLGANESPRPDGAWDVLVDWPPDEEAPTHFSFYGRKDERGAAREPLFEQEAAVARREELNLLYVALTRARQVFLASGIEYGREKAGTPYRLIAAALERLGQPNAYGDVLPLLAVATPESMASMVSTALLPSPVAALPAVGERRLAPDAAERFGILLHALLERRTAGEAPAEAESSGWWRRLGFSDAEFRRVAPVAETVLGAPHLQDFFDPSRYLRAWNEIELSGGDGRLLRIDRLVDRSEALWVIDYKSSRRETARLAEYREQVAGYCRTVAQIFPQRPVRGALVFADGALVEVA